MQSLALDAERSLRPVAGSDLEELHTLVSANRRHLAPWMPWAADVGREGTRTFLATAQAQANDGNGVQFAIVECARIVGTIGYHHINRMMRSTSLGYWLDAGAQGRGTMTLAVTTLVDHAFDAWDLHRLEIKAAVDNARSRAIAQRLGFVEEGIMRDGERFGDRYVDLVMYSMLAPDWRARRAQA